MPESLEEGAGSDVRSVYKLLSTDTTWAPGGTKIFSSDLALYFSGNWGKLAS